MGLSKSGIKKIIKKLKYEGYLVYVGVLKGGHWKAIQDKARPILEKTGQLGEIFKLLAIDEKIYFATDGMIQKYLLDETTLSSDIKEAKSHGME